MLRFKKKERLAFALKVFSGAEAVWPSTVASILEQINYANKDTIAALRAIRPSLIKSAAGIEVGEICECFTLQKSTGESG